jgi:hypothetical protein
MVGLRRGVELSGSGGWGCLAAVGGGDKESVGEFLCFVHF